MKTVFLQAFLTLYVTSPGTPLDWSAPGPLFSSVMKNMLSFEENPLGLTVTAIDCPEFKEKISVVPKDFGLLGELLIEGRGLGLLYQTFKGQEIDATQELRENLKLPRTRLVRYKLNVFQCARIREFLKEFREKKIPSRFGLPHRPLHAEGATGTSLGVALLDVAGVLGQTERYAWDHGLYLPDKLSGMPLKEQYVGFFSLMGSSWGKGDEKSSILHFWDPQKIAHWVDETVKADPQRLIKEGEAVGVEIDRSHLPAPAGTWWEQANP